MDNTPWNTWDIGKLTDFPIQNLDSLFKNKGIEVSAEEQSNIEEAIRKNPDLIKYIEQDILAIQGNPTEKSRFETLYIKGFWQVVVIDWKTMRFSEISWLSKKEKEAIINGMTRIDKIWFREWELEAANQTEKKIDWNIQAANQRIEWKKEIEQAANQNNETETKISEQENEIINKKLVNHARSLIDQNGNNFISTELQKIQTDPAESTIGKSLINQWISINAIKDGKMNAILEMHIISNNERILTPKDPEKALEFSRVVYDMRKRIGIPTTRENIDAFGASMVLGEKRENIIHNMHQIWATGMYDRMTWDSANRTIVFHGKNGTRIIETTTNPPTERVIKNGLSISREVPILSPEQKEIQEKINTSKKKLHTNESIYNQWLIDIDQMEQRELSIKWERWANNEETQNTVDIYSTIFLTENQEKESEYIKSKNEILSDKISIEDREKIIESILTINEEMKKNNLGKLLSTGETENHNSINRMLEWRIEKYKQLQRSNNEIKTAMWEISKNSDNTINNENFDNNAQSTLSYLSHIGYDELSQDVLDKIIASVNAKNQWKIAEINLNKNPKLDTAQEKELLRVLAMLSRKSDIMRMWRWTNPTDEIIAARQLSSPNWRISLQDINKSTIFQQMKWVPRDVFTRYLYEKPEEKPSTNKES